MLKSYGEDAPSGENLEYDPDFIAMELAAQPEEERQAGSEIVEGSDPDYKDLASKARVILERSHDIRAAVYLADSELRLKGLTGFAEITTYIRGCLEEYWDTCHPQLDEEDDNDPMMRINAVTGLAGRTTILRGLRTAAYLTNSRVMGRVTLRDFEILNGDVTPSDDETPKSSSEIEAAFTDTADEEIEAFYNAAKTALDDVNAIDAVFLAKTPGYGPSLEELQKLLNKIIKLLSKYVKSADSIPDAVDEPADTGGAPRPAARGGGVPGSIESRSDVTAALDRIMDYYSRHEPSSPLPILLKRAKRLVGAEFMEIINDLAPEGAANVRLIGGVADSETTVTEAAESGSSDW